MKRILFIVSDIHLNGGGERVTFNMADYFITQNYDVTVLSFDNFRDKPLFSHDEKIQVEYLNIQNTKFLSKNRVYMSLKNFLKSKTFDIVFGIGLYPSIMLGLIKKFNKNILSNSISVGCEHSSFIAANFLWKTLRESAYPSLNAVVTLTQDDLVKVKQINTSAFVIPNSIQLPQEYSKLQSKRFVSVGRLSPGKRFDLMINIFRIFLESNSEWHLDIVGEGPEKDKLDSMISEYGLHDSITIHPFSHNISEYYLTSSIFLMTSITEGLPMVLLEAKAYGLPIISFDCDTGPRDIIRNEEDGFLIPMDNIQSFIGAMKTITNDMDLRLKFGERGRENAKAFAPDKIFAKWKDLLSKL